LVPTNPANAILVFARLGGASSIPTATVADDGQNSYTLLGSCVQPNFFSVDYVWVATGSSAITVTTKGNGTTTRIDVLEVFGLGNVDGFGCGEGNGQVATSGIVSTTRYNDLIFGAASTAGATALSTGTGFTSVDTAGKLATQFSVKHTPGNVSSVFQLAAPDYWADIVIAFSSAAPINLPVSGTLLFDDKTPVAFGVNLNIDQWNGNAWVSVGSITSDASGNISGTLSINPSFADPAGFIHLDFSISETANDISQILPLNIFQQGSIGVTADIVVFKTLMVPKFFSVGLVP
jgi:hypothetical protein